MESFLAWEYMPLIPPLLTLVLVILTRKVGISLGAGIITSAFVVAGGSIMETLGLLWEAFIGIFIDEGSINTWEAFILIFLTLLGIMTAFMNMSGGAKAFTSWALKRFRTRRSAGLATGFLGIIIFIDDYFSALVTGQVARPLTDKFNISRAKLAYYVDTTAAPVSVIAPISSWGAGIMGLVAPLLLAAGLTSISPFQAFIYMIPMNFYVITALVMMFIVILTRFDFGPMRKQERLAIQEGILVDQTRDVPGATDEDLPSVNNSSAQALLVPMIGLAATVIGMMYITGGLEAGSWDLYSVLESTLVTHSLIAGGIVGLVLSLFYYFSYTKNNKEFGSAQIWIGIKNGLKAMYPAMLVLTLAWMIGNLISQLGTGDVLGAMVEESNLPVSLLLGLVFVVACIMALATGTSWGSFGILIPVTGEIIISLGETELLLPAVAAVLAGSVFGDHCSPISDSTILASTGAGSNHITHVMTQLPYAFLSAGIALVGYIVLGFTASVWLSLLTLMVLLAVMVLVLKVVYKPIEESA